MTLCWGFKRSPAIFFTLSSHTEACGSPYLAKLSRCQMLINLPLILSVVVSGNMPLNSKKPSGTRFMCKSGSLSRICTKRLSWSRGCQTNSPILSRNRSGDLNLSIGHSARPPPKTNWLFAAAKDSARTSNDNMSLSTKSILSSEPLETRTNPKAFSKTLYRKTQSCRPARRTKTEDAAFQHPNAPKPVSPSN